MTRTRRRILYGALALVGLGVVGLGAHEVRNMVVVQQACDAVRALPGPIVHTHDGSLKVTVLGDSYSSGDTLTDRHDAWVYKVPADWDVSVNAVGATGYVATGACRDSAFDTRVKTVLATHPDLLIIQGGLNDVSATPDQLTIAANKLLTQFSTVHRIVMVGPVDSPARTGEATVDKSLARVAKQHSVQYVSALDWDEQFNATRLHLTPQGHQTFADEVVAAINEG